MQALEAIPRAVPEQFLWRVTPIGDCGEVSLDRIGVWISGACEVVSADTDSGIQVVAT